MIRLGVRKVIGRLIGHWGCLGCLSLALLLSSGGAAFAQSTSQVPESSAPARAQQGQAPEAGGQAAATNGGASLTPLPASTQEDIGDIRPADAAPLSSYFRGQASLNTQYISNAGLYHSHDEADFMIVPSVEEGVSLPVGKFFKVNADVRVEDFTYVSHQSLGFYGASGDLDMEFRYKPTWPRFYVGTEPYYYFTYDTGDRLTSAIGPVAGVDETYSINRGKTLLLVAYHFGHYYSGPSIDTRQSHTVTVALTQQIKPDLYAELYYQWQYSRYTIAGRDENRSVVGISLIHQFTPTTFMSLFVNYEDNASNNSLAKYTNVDAGLSMILEY